jgi:hypothetical protein
MLKRIGMPLICFSPFDAGTFMNQSVDAQLDTQIKQCPEGEFRAMIDDFGEDAWRTFQGKKDPSKDYTMFAPPFVIQDPGVQAELGRDKVVVYHKGIFIDIGPDGGLDTAKGKNVDLGRLRDAVGQNKPGPWNFNMLKGAGPVMVKVIHEPDQHDTEKKYARISKVVKIG